MEVKLIDLLPGEKGKIIRIEEKSILRKRLREMGIRAGQEIMVRRNAPMGDPIELSVMNYNISIRRSEASAIILEKIESAVKKKDKIIVALIGNPNCGKTTLFNLLTGSRQHVGNWPGVTVEKKEGTMNYKGTKIQFIDLPGVYSLTPNSIEEKVTLNYLKDETPDLVVNILDGTTLERSLYLTTELIDMHVRMVLAVNMIDETKAKGIDIQTGKIEVLLGVPVVPIAAKKETGMEALLDTIIESRTQDPEKRVHINYGEDFESAINELECSLSCFPALTGNLSTRWAAIQLLLGTFDDILIKSGLPEDKELIASTEALRKKLKPVCGDDLDIFKSDRHFGFIMGIMKECVIEKKREIEKRDFTEAIDSIFLNKYLSFPIFALILWLTFQLTFVAGSFFSNLIQKGIDLLSMLIVTYMPAGMLKDLFVNGIISGVGGILVFLPQILILFLIIAILEDSGYMARVAFIMDRLMHFLGVHGKSFISIFMGIGCNVPGIMAARTLENEEDRIVTVLINPFMSCSARLPIYILIAGMFFGKFAGTAIFSLYFLGILVAIITAKLLKTVFFRKKSVPFVMELPPYRGPSLKSLLIHMWERASMFLRKMGGVILAGSIIIWALGYFPRLQTNSDTTNNLLAQYSNTTVTADKALLKSRISSQQSMEQLEYSYIGRIGKAVEPFFKPLGFSWKEDVAIITGVTAKEIVVSTISVLYGGREQSSSIKSRMTNEGMKTSTAYGFLVFILLYIPCLATISAVLKETNSLKWTLFSIFYGIGVGYLVSFLMSSMLRFFNV